jgi:hypothetical protein
MKRRTKQQKEADERAALRRRVLDMAFGAFGWYSGAESIDPTAADHAGMFGAMSPDALGRWIGAVAVHLIKADRDGKSPYLLLPHCIDKWDSLEGIVDALYNQGIRA